MVMDKVIATTPRPVTMLNTTLDDPEEPCHEDTIQKIQMMIQETSPVQVYQALQSPTIRESLNIPTALWKVLEPKMKERIMELRSEIRKKKEQEKNMTQARQNSFPLPSQYANKTSMQLVANSCSQLTQNDSEGDTDDDILTQSYCATTCEDEVQVEYKAHLE